MIEVIHGSRAAKSYLAVLLAAGIPVGAGKVVYIEWERK